MSRAEVEMSCGLAADSDGQAGLEYLETIAILQEEIARLENQLLDREGGGAESA